MIFSVLLMIFMFSSNIINIQGNFCVKKTMHLNSFKSSITNFWSLLNAHNMKFHMWHIFSYSLCQNHCRVLTGLNVLKHSEEIQDNDPNWNFNTCSAHNCTSIPSDINFDISWKALCQQWQNMEALSYEVR